MEELSFPQFDYFLDESDPDVVILRRQDGSFVAAIHRGAWKVNSQKFSQFSSDSHPIHIQFTSSPTTLRPTANQTQ